MTSTSNTIAPRAEQSWNPALRLLSASSSIQAPSVVAGFDGFVDTIRYLVTRSSFDLPRAGDIEGVRAAQIQDDFFLRSKGHHDFRLL